jgi:serine/threonine protein kinase
MLIPLSSMKTERWQQINQLLQAAFEIAPAERAAFLNDACKDDPALRQEVEALLACDETAGSFIKSPAIEVAAELMVTEQHTLRPGQQISHYHIASEIGAGGMGQVFLATDTRLGRRVALKVLQPAFTRDEMSLRRFHQEARAASALNHPNIITVYEIGQAEDLHFIATEFIEGETLRTILQRGDVELDRLLGLLTQVTDGLTKAHAAGIIHRDLKPENLMITPDGYAKVLDFGMAKLVRPPQTKSDRTTETVTAIMGTTQPGVVMGTVGYMSPEQAEGKALDQRSDIFSFGCILYEVVTGHRPFEGNSLLDILHKIVNAEPPPVIDDAPQCPAALRRIIRKCLVKNPERRYQSIKDVAVDLRDLAEGQEVELSLSTSQPAFQGQVTTEQPPATETVETKLIETNPEVRRARRFSRASLALAIFGVMGAVVLWSAYRAGDIGSELRLEYPRVAALSKAREIVASLGYEVSGLQESSSFIETGIDLKRVAATQGVAEARRAVQEGKAAVWRFFLFQPDARAGAQPWVSGDRSPKPGEFIVRLDPQGQLVSFFTPPREDVKVTGPDREQAIRLAEETARRMLLVDVSGYETEFISKSDRPGVAEITWRNRELVFGHREVVRVNLQGAQVTFLSRYLELPQEAGVAKSKTQTLLTTIEYVRFGAVMLGLIVVGSLGVGFLIKSKRWRALWQKLPITGGVITTVAMVATMIVLISENLMIFIIPILILAVSVGVMALVIYAGLFEWLRTLNAWRLYGAEQILSRHLLSQPAASALVHGVLAGALVAAIHYSFTVLMTLTPGYSPSSSIAAIRIITTGGPAAFVLSILAGTLGYTLIVAVIVELAEKLIRSPIVATLIPALLLAVTKGVDEETPADIRVFAVRFLSAFFISIVIVQLYRSYGFAAALLVSLIDALLRLAVVAAGVGDPGITLQANLILAGVALLLALGVWGYVGDYLKKKLTALVSS